MKPLGIAVIGTGRLGRVYARAVAAMTEARLVAVADVDAEVDLEHEVAGDARQAPRRERGGEQAAADADSLGKRGSRGRAQSDQHRQKRNERTQGQDVIRLHDGTRL